MKTCDIVLVFPNFRRNAAYLSIIKHLSEDFDIGIVKVPINSPGKTLHVDKLFLEMCEKLGAKIIPPGEKVSTNLLVVPQWQYSRDAVTVIRNTVSESRKNICTCALTWAGMNDELFETFDIHKIYVTDKNLFSFLLKRKNLPIKFHQEIVEVGLPFEKYPVFDEPPDIDYIIAMPTPFSFPQKKSKIVFLENVTTVLNEISNTNHDYVVAIKRHNATKSEHFLNRKFEILSSFLNKLGLNFLTKSIRHGSSFSLLATIDSLYHDILNRVTPLDSLTPDSEFPLEIFLPFVKKGVIGGLSNTMWGALFFKKPYFNCIPDSVRRQLGDNLTLKISLDYFGIPFCNSSLMFDAHNFEKISDSTRKADLLEIIRKELYKK
jgi:hypothetical protein